MNKEGQCKHWSSDVLSFKNKKGQCRHWLLNYLLSKYKKGQSKHWPSRNLDLRTNRANVDIDFFTFQYLRTENGQYRYWPFI